MLKRLFITLTISSCLIRSAFADSTIRYAVFSPTGMENGIYATTDDPGDVQYACLIQRSRNHVTNYKTMYDVYRFQFSSLNQGGGVWAVNQVNSALFYGDGSRNFRATLNSDNTTSDQLPSFPLAKENNPSFLIFYYHETGNEADSEGQLTARPLYQFAPGEISNSDVEVVTACVNSGISGVQQYLKNHPTP